MKKIFIAAAAVLLAAAVQAQDCASYIPAKEGTVFENTTYDKKNKPTGKSQSKIVSIKSEGAKRIFSVNSTTTQGDQTAQIDYDMVCENGTFSVNMKNLYGSQLSSQYQGMKTDITSDNLVYPSALAVGQSLPDASIKVVATIEGMPGAMGRMTVTMDIKNRKVAAKESVTTPAGTFECYKIEYDVISKTVATVSIHACEWVSVNVGTVKSENYDKKGQVESYTLLTLLR